MRNNLQYILKLAFHSAFFQPKTKLSRIMVPLLGLFFFHSLSLSLYPQNCSKSKSAIHHSSSPPPLPLSANPPAISGRAGSKKERRSRASTHPFWHQLNASLEFTKSGARHEEDATFFRQETLSRSGILLVVRSSVLRSLSLSEGAFNRDPCGCKEQAFSLRESHCASEGVLLGGEWRDCVVEN